MLSWRYLQIRFNLSTLNFVDMLWVLLCIYIIHLNLLSLILLLTSVGILWTMVAFGFDASGGSLRVCLVCIFIFCFHFLFSFSENCFHFQKIRILKICLVWLLVFCFHEIKILKIYDILISYFFVFLDLLKITF